MGNLGKFNEVWDVLHKENLEALKDKKSKSVSFSRKKKADLTKALLNTPEYETEYIKTKNGEFTKEKGNPVEDFRKMFIGKVLMDNGIDRQQAEKQVKEYEFSSKQADALYALECEDIEQYLRAGFTFKMPDKEDLSASIKMKTIPETVTTAKAPQTGTIIRTKEKEHKVITKKSGTPKICKERLL